MAPQDLIIKNSMAFILLVTIKKQLKGVQNRKNKMFLTLNKFYFKDENFLIELKHFHVSNMLKVWCANISNPGQNILNEIEKSCKTEQEKKSLIFTFACFFIAIAKV